jgi:PAS domain S-box-containing protein
LVNRAWEEFIGMRREEVIGRSLDELLPPAMAKHFKKVNQQVMDTGAPVITEEFVEVADGRHYFYTVKFPMHDALGQIEAVGGISIDMTERKQAEEALRKSEERFRLAVDNVPDVFVIYDAQRRLQFVNAEGLRRSGLSEEALLGHTDEELFPPEVTQGYLPTLQRAVETRTSQTTECSITLPTIGTSTIVVTYVPLLDDRGEIYSILGITHDLTERKQAEVQLQHSEEKFRQLAENIHEVFWMTNANVREILYVSPAYEQIWGRSCESLYVNPKSFRDAIHPDDQQRVSAHLEPNVTGTFDIEYRIVRPDGSVRWIRDRGFPIRNESGEIYRRAGIAQDITQRKQAEAILRQVNEELEIRVAERTAELSQANERLQHELFERERVEQALRQSEEHFRSAFDYAAIGMALVALDGRWLKVNHSLCEIVGYSEQELLATAFQAITHPDDLDTDLGYAGQLLAGEIRSYQMEKRYFHKLGHVVWIFLSGSLVRDAQSQPLYFIAQIQDITARKQAEEARRESEERLQAILDNATAIIYLKDTEGRFILINRQLETLFQKPKEEILGKNNYDFFPKEMADTFHANDRRVIEAGTPLEFEEIAPHDDGIHTYISIKFPLKDPEGIPYAVCGISTDISDRKRAEDARRASEEQLQAILDNSPAVIYLIDAQNRHLLINRGYENLVSMTNEEIVGKVYTMFGPMISLMCLLRITKRYSKVERL